ncbi:hypothetical protein S7711_04847 [Stachybotrys chartarum IBT 7711]|uniref:Uracil-DNA glycosylase n=1 Tax=Stachybotrys chartarum (strain CBS 109288 / IBT 7711) TaxID=1280523 RepID=A0A084AMJ2_STACB|nr:hypothetical protein S7711_04847 [Stachybotrys chartarum IBT 7711]KFA51067.1 hypothetical protein S40293_08223 [Stachybotrys chartarum IBT 40293]KFA78451.1 hypothetical protein S40288_06925 [Stachybotrys chartarum IBT 40288]
MASLKRKADAGVDDAAAKKPKAQGSLNAFFTPVAKTKETATATAAKFDKKKWVQGLTPEQKELLSLEIETLDESWLSLLKDEIVTKEFLELKRFLNRETAAGKKWFPPKEDIYSWSRHTPFNTVKVVILGQDPYHNVNQAHGMAFSVRPPTPAPPSLRNMYIALKKDYPTFVPPKNNGGLLIPWADRGVLMLNTCLTVRAHEANSHSNRGWERFTQKVIDIVVQKRNRGVVFMAWGTPAGKRVQKVDRERHLVLQSVHPSPLSASRGFFDCGHFKKANEWLVSRYGDEGEIDWALMPGTTTKTAVAEETKQEVNKTIDETVKQADQKRTARTDDELDSGITSDDEKAMDEALEKADQAVKANK